jgi:putative DNA primase/helicase
MALRLTPETLPELPPTDPDPDYTPEPTAGLVLDRGWEEYVTRTAKGHVHATVPNAATILSHDVGWRDVLCWDELEQRPVWRRERPAIEGWPVVPAGTVLLDEHADAVGHWLYRAAGIQCSRAATLQALQSAALAHPWSPVAEYLEGLVWDGARRVEDWLVRYLGCAPVPYHGDVGAWWLRQAVARALEPGCQGDYSLALEGPQGAGKSSALRILGGRWYREVTLDLSDRREAAMALRGGWICELAEMASIRRSTTEAIKSYLTATRDRYRPPYGVCDVDHPRRCVFAATTNAHVYLTDPSGARRWWPAQCGDIDLEALERDRDQLWAEAVVQYRAGAQRWPTRSQQAHLSLVVDERHESDPWEPALDRLMVLRRELSLADCLAALDIRPQDQDPRAASRIRAIAQRLGWERDTHPRRREEGRVRCWTARHSAIEGCAGTVPGGVPEQDDGFIAIFGAGTDGTALTI